MRVVWDVVCFRGSFLLGKRGSEAIEGVDSTHVRGGGRCMQGQGMGVDYVPVLMCGRGCVDVLIGMWMWMHSFV